MRTSRVTRWITTAAAAISTMLTSGSASGRRRAMSPPDEPDAVAAVWFKAQSP